MNYQELANELNRALALSLPPIAVAFCDAVPAGVAPFDGAAPAGCAFWEKAAARAFSTSAKDHGLCAIGMHTHNLPHTAASESELQDALQAMAGLDYVRAEEVAAIPVAPRRAQYVVYGPLADFPAAPEVALLFADARQGLVITEAAARVDRGAPPALGRPACAVIPQVLTQGVAAQSLGCCGARAYIDALSDGVALWAFPAAKLEDYCKEIKTLASANKTLSAFHERRREDVESGKRPTVRESLARLSS
ncbi:MAG TPA: DUF169 domain-containing protein [Candidatus Binatia bacterium]|jgi:uncharacterized protein (DUF169 family)